jgi:predicted nucleic acid-binding protein
MILLDTNILSELIRSASEKGVEHWLAVQPDASVFVSGITEAELRCGVALLPPGKRRSLSEVIEDMLATIDHPGSRLHELLPWSWKRSIPKAAAA